MPFSTPVADSVPRASHFRDPNEGKADFSDAYSRSDPRAYAAVLGGLEYRVPTEALPLFRRLVAARRARDGRAALRIADVGCSFGFNAALLKHDVSLRSLFARYRTTPLNDLPRGLLMRSDREFFASTLEDDKLSFVGIDVSATAIDYAERVGLLDAGVCEDLERHPPSAGARARLSGIDLVISTGCVGYVGERTFERILDCQNGAKPWIASFVLRMFPYDRIAGSLALRGYVTEKLPARLFAQRRVSGEEERRHMLDALGRRGITPHKHEHSGIFLAEFFLSRPATEAKCEPLAQLAAGAR